MKQLSLSVLTSCILFCGASAQNLNGQLDDISELSTKQTIPITMPDGIKLMTDVYLPILRDSLMIDIDIPLVGNQRIQLLPRGVQYIMYDSINGQPNPLPFQLPMVFSRTPYNKGSWDQAAAPINILGYSYAVQDMRGRYQSEGVYMPLLSDGWNKNAYHPEYGHILDVTPLSDPRNGNRHEDGYNSIQAILAQNWPFDNDGNGVMDTTDKLTNGRIGMFGASALGYNQYQAAAARKIDPNAPGLKCLIPIVATQEFYRSTGFQNGVFRDNLVTGWLKGQIFTGTDDDLNALDNDIDNDMHSSADYGLPNKFEAANRAINHFAVVPYRDGLAGYYPNHIGRSDMDASRAPVNAQGLGDPNGTISRYTNMEVPMFHFTGWWDIFIDGQIETWQLLKKHLDPNKKSQKLQKIIIGPWAHQTMGSRTTGDMTYPQNVTDIIGISLDDFSNTSLPIAQALQSEIISWYRYNMNYDSTQFLGEPKAFIPESQVWNTFATIFKVRVPAANYKIPLHQLIAFMNGTGGLNGLKIAVKDILTNNENIFTIDVPALGNPLIPGFDTGNINPIPYKDFSTVPDVRIYVVGPVDDGVPENENVGNYWFGTDHFPMWNGIRWENYYLHQNGTLDKSAPTTDEGFKIIVHDPNEPVRTIGGGNMLEKTPDGLRDSQGQFDLTQWTQHTMDIPGVIQFESSVLTDTVCIIGFPEATLYAKSNPSGVQNGPTDTDFFVRIVDVYPDGRELFVVEGCVNARARAYAKSLLINQEDDNAVFDNINIGEIYEYAFRMLPIAYTFGRQHKIKILISSSNYTRYQVNPNLPIMPGEFFRRKPGDGQKYTYNGVLMTPRVAINRVAFSNAHPSHIRLPIYDQALAGVEEAPTTIEPTDALVVYPNPTSAEALVSVNYSGSFELSITDISGKAVMSKNFVGDQSTVNVQHLSNGMYSITVKDLNNGKRFGNKLIKK
jgi:predicted acyl esterase